MIPDSSSLLRVASVHIIFLRKWFRVDILSYSARSSAIESAKISGSVALPCVASGGWRGMPEPFGPSEETIGFADLLLSSSETFLFFPGVLREVAVETICFFFRDRFFPGVSWLVKVS